MAAAWSVIVCAAVSPLFAAAPLDRHRLQHMFDFEEADDLNFETMPMNWYVVGRSDESSDRNFLRVPLHQQQMRRKGFPHFSKVQFDRPQSKKGNHRLQLHIDGASAGAFLEVGTLAAVPDSDYLVTATINTTRLKHARARLLVYFVDAAGKRIDETAVSSQLLNTNGQNIDIALKLTGHAKAAWIGMQAELLQPQLQPGYTADAHQVDYQEVRGDAWFDDIGVWQVPRITVRTQSKVNVIVAPDKPYLAMEVRDLAAQHLRAHVAVFDHELNFVDEIRRNVGGNHSSLWQWQPTVRKYGWYLVDMILYDTTPLASVERLPGNARLVGRTIGAFLWVPQRSALTGLRHQRFTIDVHDGSVTELKYLPDVLKRSGLSSVAVSAFSRNTTLATLGERHELLDDLLLALRAQNGEAIVNFSPLPRAIVDRQSVGRDDPLWLLAQPADQWQAYIAPLTLKHGQQVRRWQFGQPFKAELAGSADAVTTISKASEALQEFAPRPAVVIPWQVHQHPPVDTTSAGTEFTINIPAAVQPGRIPDHLQAWKKRVGSPPLIAHLRVPDATEVSHTGRTIDLATRMMYAWAGGADGIEIDRPWAIAGHPDKHLFPDPLLGVYATVSRELNNRKPVGWLPLGKGVKALILDGPRGGALAVWNESAPQEAGVLDMYLGEKPQATDVFGNAVTIERSGQGHRIVFGKSPILVTGIDAKLALFRASFGFKPFLLKSLLTNHEHKLSLTNPWSHRIQGMLMIKSPGKEWRINPRQLRFFIAPGETVELPIELQFPPSETAGIKKLAADFDFIADDTHYRLNVDTAFELGLPGIHMESTLSTQRNKLTGQLDAIVTLFINNTGDHAQSLYEFAVLEGFPRQERLIASLDPGEMIVRRFRFPGAGENLQNTPVRTGLRELSGPALMNHILKLDE